MTTTDPTPTPAQVLTAAQIEALVCLATGQETLIAADEFMPLIPLGLIQPKVDPVDLRMSYTLTQAGAVITETLRAQAEALAEREAECERLRAMNREMIAFWRNLGNPMLAAAARDLEEKLAALTQPTPEPDASHKVPQVEP